MVFGGTTQMGRWGSKPDSPMVKFGMKLVHLKSQL